jgi:hypothetical protein
MSTELTEVTAISMQRRACKVFHQRKNIVRTIPPPKRKHKQLEVAILNDTHDYIFMSSRLKIRKCDMLKLGTSENSGSQGHRHIDGQV